MRRETYIISMMRLTVWMMTVIAMLCAGCSSHDDTVEEPQQPVLTIYVYAPEHPVMTRGDVGDVDAIAGESTISSLQLWVFTHDSGDLVGYLSPATGTLNTQQSDAYLMDVSSDYAQSHPNVDVYVVANAAAAGLTLTESTTRSELEAARIGTSAFGGVSPTTVVTQSGLPMSGVLRNQTVVGDNPVLRIGTLQEMATVRLLRTVSKVRFVFTRSSVSTETVSITGITLDADMIPTEEYLFLADDGNNYNIGDTYVETAADTLSTGISGALASCSDPLDYEYTAGTEAQAYEDLIDGGVADGKLSQAGPYYLRESDKQLSGTISYTVDGTPKQATFQMAQAGDFSRNHTWIVYGYFSGGNSSLELNSIFVKDWTDVNMNHELYNW